MQLSPHPSRFVWRIQSQIAVGAAIAKLRR
jgi:hypothetical protein